MESWSETLETKYDWVDFSEIDKSLLKAYDESKGAEGVETNKGEVSIIHDFTPSFLGLDVAN